MTNGSGTLKNSKSELILSALLCSPTVKAAALVARVPQTTIYTWLRKPEFKAEYDRRRREIISDTANYLRSLTREAADVVADIMNDPNTQAQTRLYAARTIFEYSIKLTETTDILERIEALEAKAVENGREKAGIA